MRTVHKTRLLIFIKLERYNCPRTRPGMQNVRGRGLHRCGLYV